MLTIGRNDKLNWATQPGQGPRRGAPKTAPKPCNLGLIFLAFDAIDLACAKIHPSETFRSQNFLNRLPLQFSATARAQATWTTSMMSLVTSSAKLSLQTKPNKMGMPAHPTFTMKIQRLHTHR